MTTQIVKDLVDLIKTLEKQPSMTLKLETLRVHKDNPLVKEVFTLAYDPHIRFQIKKRLKPELYCLKYVDSAAENLEEALKGLREVIASEELTGDLAKIYLWKLRRNLTKAEEEIYWRVVEKDLRVGLNRTSIEKVWQGVTSQIGVMLAGSNPESIRYPAYSQTKADGCRTILTVKQGELTFRTRNNKIIPITTERFLAEARQLSDGEYDGELILVQEGNTLPRTKGNGYINSMINGGTLPEYVTPCLVLWDKVSSNPYGARFQELQDILSKLHTTWIRLVETKTVESYEEARDHYESLRKRGEEGSILKNIDALWVPKRSSDLCKLKGECSGEFIVVGWTEGTGKNAGKLGALRVTSRDNKVVASVGTGFTDKQREEFTPNMVIGQIVEVKYNTIIKSKVNYAPLSLFLPRFIDIRFDKNEANTLSELQKKELI